MNYEHTFAADMDLREPMDQTHRKRASGVPDVELVVATSKGRIAVPSQALRLCLTGTGAAYHHDETANERVPGTGTQAPNCLCQ